MITVYDLNDNLIAYFETIKECAIWFNTSTGCIYSHISRLRKGIVDKKLNKQDHKWYRIFKLEEDDVN